ncbi:MAG: DUF58 domain-containing protein [Acidimicrobiia bacterium]
MRRARLTRRGWALLGASVGLFAGGRILGTVELWVVATTGVALVVASLAWARTRPVDLEIRRTVQPARLHVGVEGRVELTAANRSGGSTPVQSVTDTFDDGRRAARFLLPPIPDGESVRAAYRLPTAHRGRYPIGPLTVALSDPFGLAKSTAVAVGVDEVIVRPRVYDVLAPPDAPGRHAATADTVRASRFAADGEDFLTLREYEVGDDLRRVHWRSSARVDELMVRIDETRTRANATVVLDTRASAHDGVSFERAVEAAASVVARLASMRRRVEVVTSTGETLGDAATGDAPMVMDRLAQIEPSTRNRLVEVIAGLRRRQRTGVLVIVTGSTSDDEFASLASLSSQYGVVTVVSTRAPVNATPSATVAASPNVVHVDATRTPFASAWNEAVSRWTFATPSLPGSRSPR